MSMRITPAGAAALALGLSLALAACSREPPPVDAPAEQAVATDPDAAAADARRIVQERAASRLLSQVRDREAAAIQGALGDMVAAWNRGDLTGFMAGYAPSHDARFASGGTVVTGWTETLARYEARYPDRAAMGRLSFLELDVDVLASDAAVVFGRGRQARAQGAPAEGLFTLVMRKSGAQWLIVHDHTSSAEAERAEE